MIIQNIKIILNIYQKELTRKSTLDRRQIGVGSDVIFFSPYFLDASTHLYMRVCPSVRPSVRPSVHPSFRRSVTRFFLTRKFDKSDKSLSVILS